MNRTLPIFLILLVGVSFITAKTTINVDGDLSDWTLDPVYLNINATSTLEISEIQLGIGSDTLWFSIFYGNTDFFSILGNITLLNAKGQVFVIQHQYVLEDDWSFTAVLRGVEQNSSLTDPESSNIYYSQEGSVGYDPVLKGVEFGIPFSTVNANLGENVSMQFFQFTPTQVLDNILLPDIELKQNIENTVNISPNLSIPVLPVIIVLILIPILTHRMQKM